MVSNCFLGNREIADFITNNYHPGFRYEEFALDITVNSFDPNKWAELFAKSGAKFVSLHLCINMNNRRIKLFNSAHFRYVVFTAKHHDGFTLFPSGRPGNWNSVDEGPKIDVVKVLSESVRNYDMKFGIYYCLIEWNSTLFLNNIAAQNTTNITINYIENVIWPDISQ